MGIQRVAHVASPAAPMPSGWRAMGVAVAAQFVVITDVMVMNPLGPEIASQLGFAPSRLGLLTAGYLVSAAVFGFALAHWADRLPRTKLVAGALMALVVGVVLTTTAHSLAWLLLGRVVVGGASGVITALGMALVADGTPPQRRARGYALLTGTYPVVAVVAVPLALWLARATDWRTPFWTLGGVALLLGPVAYALPTPLRQHPDAAGSPVVLVICPSVQRRKLSGTQASTKALEYTLLASGLMTFAVFLIVPNLPTYLRLNLGVTRRALEVYYLLGGGLSVLAVLMITHAIRALGTIRTIWLGTMLMIAPLWLWFGPCALEALPMLGFSVFMASGIVRQVPLQTLANGLVEAEVRGQWNAWLAATANLMAALGATLGAALLHSSAAGPLAGFQVVIAIATCGALPVPWLLAAARTRQRGHALAP